jgi:hypothetical protein
MKTWKDDKDIKQHEGDIKGCKTILGKHHETLELLFLGQQGDDREIRQHWKDVKKHQTTWMRHQRMLGNIGGHEKKSS